MLQITTSSTVVQNLASVGYSAAVFVLIVAVSWVIGRLGGLLVGRLTARAGAEPILRQTVVGRALLKSGFTASTLASALTKSIIYLVGFLFALESLNMPPVTAAVAASLAYLPRLIGAMIIFIVGVILSDWIGELIQRSASPEMKQVLYPELIGAGAKVILYFITITIALTYLGVDTTILYIIAQALSWAVAIAVGVATGIVVGWLLKDRVKAWLAQ